MTQPRSKRTDTPADGHPDDVWRPGVKARMARRLPSKLRERRRETEPERADPKPD